MTPRSWYLDSRIEGNHSHNEAAAESDIKLNIAIYLREVPVLPIDL